MFKQTFSYENFRQGKLTGVGKSLCNKIPSIIDEKKTTLISPLVPSNK